MWDGSSTSKKGMRVKHKQDASDTALSYTTPGYAANTEPAGTAAQIKLLSECAGFRGTSPADPHTETPSRRGANSHFYFPFPRSWTNARSSRYLETGHIGKNTSTPEILWVPR